MIKNVEEIEAGIENYNPAAIILDLQFKEDRTAGAEMVQIIRRSSEIGCPIIVLTVHDDFDARLAAVRANSNYFVTKPVTLTKIVHLLDNLTATAETQPERIMIIDDDPDIRDYVQNSLQAAGMIVETVSDPTTTLEEMKEFSPELLLVDLHMPECNGKELAAIIRQKPEFSAIPIVYLSSENDTAAQYDAMSVGADDFLTKPINPRILAPAVRLRVARFRVLCDLMARDSLTGLFNHATTKQLLETELFRAHRADTEVTFAMLDIDHFKVVNDTYGHSTGDTVIKLLSSILTHRLRHGDVVGRLGGEEFGVILPGTSVDQAHTVMEAVRVGFEEISQNVAGSDAPITLSCGIAAFPQCESAVELCEAADLALYEGKHAGRNITVLAKPRNRYRPETPDVPADKTKVDMGDAPIERRRSASLADFKDSLVIDDNSMICEFIRPFAESAGFRVEPVTDPMLFPGLYHAKIKLIVLDLHMPGMDGIEILRFLGINKYRGAIVLISGYDQEILASARILARKQELNIIAALRKPIIQDELKRALKTAYEEPGRSQFDAVNDTARDLPSVPELRDAINNDLLEVYYQPKVSLPTKTVLGVEVLVRWQHPQYGFIPPDYFVPLAERNNLIGKLTLLVLNQVFAQRKHLSHGDESLMVSVNISEQCFSDLDFPETISGILTEAGQSFSHFVLELTETSLATDTIYIMDVLTRLRLKGFQISIDDFGTGHSSLTRLSDLPFNEIKIDKSFVGKADKDPVARAIVKNTIDLGKSMGLSIVAEGAETQEQINMLESLGCDIVQGFFFSKALPVHEFRQWLKNYETSAKVKDLASSEKFVDGYRDR